MVSNEEAENFADLAIDTETAEAGTLGMTDEDGTALKAADADGNVVDCGIVDLGNGMSSVTYGEVTVSDVSFSVASTLDTVHAQARAARARASALLPVRQEELHPHQGIVLMLIIGILGALPLNEWLGITWWTGLW